MNTPLPEHAGGIPLDFHDYEQRPARISRPDQPQRLILPKREGMEFHPLKGGEQFLVIYPRTGSWSSLEGRAFFGGMDESAFITALEPAAVDAFRQTGEEGFFEALIPKAIKLFSKKFPGAPVRRQGDIWSIQLPMTWEDVAAHLLPPRMISENGRRRARKKIRRQNQKTRIGHERHLQRFADVSALTRRVLETENHELQGRCVPATRYVFDGIKMAGMKAILAEGVLSAPDHASHELVGGPHLLVRTPHIAPLIILVGGD